MTEIPKLFIKKSPSQENTRPDELALPKFEETFIAAVLAVSKIKTQKTPAEAMILPAKKEITSKITDTIKNGPEAWCGSSCPSPRCPGSCTVTADHSGTHYGNCGHTW